MLKSLLHNKLFNNNNQKMPRYKKIQKKTQRIRVKRWKTVLATNQ